jgi:hypothetical protein
MKKILYSLSTVAISVSPIVAVVSCTTSGDWKDKERKGIDKFKNKAWNLKKGLIKLSSAEKQQVKSYYASVGWRIQKSIDLSKLKKDVGNQIRRRIRDIVEPKLKKLIKESFEYLKNESIYGINFRQISIVMKKIDKDSLIDHIFYYGSWWKQPKNGKKQLEYANYSIRFNDVV